MWFFYKVSPKVSSCFTYWNFVLYIIHRMQVDFIQRHILNSFDEILGQHLIVLDDFSRLNDSPIRNFPLKQVVKSPTRTNADLDKIFTTIEDWYCNRERC